jgi:hypothetical protein
MLGIDANNATKSAVNNSSTVVMAIEREARCMATAASRVSIDERFVTPKDSSGRTAFFVASSLRRLFLCFSLHESKTTALRRRLTRRRRS